MKLFGCTSVFVLSISAYNETKTSLQDLSGRPYLGYNLEIPTQRVGNYDTQVLQSFYFSYFFRGLFDV